MQQLGTATFTVDGVTVFSDHADPSQFWYLPSPVSLNRRADGRFAFTFLKWRPAAVASGAKGGGFAMFETSLRLPSETEAKIKAQAAARGGAAGGVRLAPVPLDEGTVRCIALDLEGSGGTAAPANQPAGTFRAVEKISGATVPSLAGDNIAAFSLALSQEGAIILEQAFTKGTTPVGVVYDLKYTVLRPALSVVITANYHDVFSHLSMGLDAQVYWVKAGIDLAFEKMRADGVIKIEVIDFTGAEDKGNKEQWALDFFKDKLLAQWFQPSISPADVEARMAHPDSLDSVLKRARDMAMPAAATGTQPASGNPAAGQGTPGRGGTPAAGQGAAPQQPAAAPARQTATLAVTIDPTPPPAGQNLRLEPGSTGDEEKLTVTGPATWTATVDGQPATLRDGHIVATVKGGAPAQEIKVLWPGTPGTPGRPGSGGSATAFQLFFDKDKPALTPNFSPTHPVALAYAGNTTTDQRFLTASGPADEPTPVGPPLGADRLRAWLETLPSPRIVDLEGHASFEVENPDALTTYPGGRDSYDRDLSMRRISVAEASLRGGAMVRSRSPKGHVDGEQAGHVDDAVDRVVDVRSTTAPTPPLDPIPAVPATTVTGRISRPAAVAPPPVTPPPVTPPAPNPHPTPPAPQPAAPASDGIPALVSFKLKYEHKEEDKTLTLRYDRTEAVQRSYAPQGFVGLMLGDIANLGDYFQEIDLDDPFFRDFEVTVDAVVDYAGIGLDDIQVAIDYGTGAEAKHKDLVFNAQSSTHEAFDTFLATDLSTAYRAGQQFHFAPEHMSGWVGEKLSYDVPAADSVDRTMVVTPYAHLGFLEIQVVPNRIDSDLLDRIEVALSFADPDGWRAEKILIVRAGSPPQTWKVRTSSPEARSYTYRLTHHLKDGTPPIVDEPVTTSAGAVSVDDPFPYALEIDFVPAWDPASMRDVFVDVTYADPHHGIDRSMRLTFAGADQAVRHLRLALRDREARQFGWKVLFVRTDGSILRKPLVLDTETLIPLIA